MRIAMVGELMEEGAGPVAELSAALTAQGHEVTVYCRQEDRGAPREVVTAAGYRVVRTASGPDDQVTADAAVLTRALDAAWARDRPDVLHTHSWTTVPAAAAAAAPRGIPTVHSFRPHPGSNGSAELEGVLTTTADRVTSTCTAHVDVLVRAGMPRAHVSIVPDGVDADLFRPEGLAEPTGSRHRLVALDARSPHAGVSTTIAALRALPDTELVVAGDPTEELREYADLLGVTDRVRFTGPLPYVALPALLRSADVAVCTPWHEPCQPGVLEAMACGVPVVATTVGPLPDIVVDKVTGLLVPPHRPRDLASALRRLLAQSVTREQYGAAGRDRVEARFVWRRIAAEFVRVYQQAGATSPEGQVAAPAPRRPMQVVP
ncbi:glycosyltransferase [Actinophytocola sp.]|uniref:glycosyltransferase n=1 Tax=Actinophytocola sp. TaxID=1872138 RepID=UPI0038999335